MAVKGEIKAAFPMIRACDYRKDVFLGVVLAAPESKVGCVLWSALKRLNQGSSFFYGSTDFAVRKIFIHFFLNSSSSCSTYQFSFWFLDAITFPLWTYDTVVRVPSRKLVE